eukprot:6542839-Alexandrium_andersonii.AAC.1
MEEAADPLEARKVKRSCPALGIGEVGDPDVLALCAGGTVLRRLARRVPLGPTHPRAGCLGRS